MATRFELVLAGDDPVRLRAAGEEALRVVVGLEARLSRFRPTSELARLNARAAAGPVRVEPSLFELLLRARALHAATDGAFDITITPLMQSWGFGALGARPPDRLPLGLARSRVGMAAVELDERRRTVRFTRPGVQLDLGGIGKGWAIDRAIDTLRELGVRTALLHGGTSSVYGLGVPPGAKAWHVAIEEPRGPGGEYAHAGLEGSGSLPEAPGTAAPVAVVPLADRALGVSAVWGRTAGEHGHVMDPVCGTPARDTLLSAVSCRDATDADALATALVVLGPGRAEHCRLPDDGHALVLAADGSTWRRGFGAPWPLPDRFPESVRVATRAPDDPTCGVDR